MLLKTKKGFIDGNAEFLTSWWAESFDLKKLISWRSLADFSAIMHAFMSHGAFINVDAYSSTLLYCGGGFNITSVKLVEKIVQRRDGDNNYW